MTPLQRYEVMWVLKEAGREKYRKYGDGASDDDVHDDGDIDGVGQQWLPYKAVAQKPL